MSYEEKIKTGVAQGLNKLLCLKEADFEILLEVSLIKTIKYDKPNWSIEAIANEDYAIILAPYSNRIMDCIVKALKAYDLSKLLKLEEKTFPFISVVLTMDENDATINGKFYFIDKLNSENKSEVDLIATFSDVFYEVSLYANSLINEYAELRDDNKLFRLSEFQFIYKRDKSNNWRYDAFARLVDRPIFQQKKEVYDLLSRNFEEKLLSIIRIKPYDNNQTLAIKFFSDGFDVIGIQTCSFDKNTN